MVEPAQDHVAGGMNTWRAGCGGSRTSGSEGGPRKPTSRNADRAPGSDPYTEHRTTEEKLYLCAVKDVCSNRIVGYSIDTRMTSRLAVTALTNALARRGEVTGCVVHTDRGSQCRSWKFVRTLARHGLSGSMGRVGAAGDNAAMESFFALLQNNVLDRRSWPTRDELRIAIVTWIDRTYHRRRRQAGLGRLTSIEYEAIMTTPASQAA